MKQQELSVIPGQRANFAEVSPQEKRVDVETMSSALTSASGTTVDDMPTLKAEMPVQLLAWPVFSHSDHNLEGVLALSHCAVSNTICPSPIRCKGHSSHSAVSSVFCDPINHPLCTPPLCTSEGLTDASVTEGSGGLE
jgi:hypothetical protein